MLAAVTAAESMYLDTIKKLRESKLLLKEDVTQHQLLLWSCQPSSKDRFEYFLAWDSEALKNTQYAGHPLLQAFERIENFAMMLKAGMKSPRASRSLIRKEQ